MGKNTYQQDVSNKKFNSFYRWFVYKTLYVHFSKFYRRQKTFWIVCFLLYSYKIQTDSIF